MSYSFQDTNGELELICAGAGLINLIALYSALELHRLERRKDHTQVIFLLDEPEAHLHPKLQGDAIEAIAQLMRDADAQIIMATHSVELINRTRFMQEATLLRIDQRHQGSASAISSSSELLAELAQWADLTPFAAINFLNSRKILFHEGATDSKLLDLCSKLHFSENPSRLKRYEQWTKCELGGTGKLDLISAWRQLLKWLPTTQPDEQLDVLIVLDRDHERLPGLHVGQHTPNTPETDTSISIKTLIWPQHSIESLLCEPQVLSHWLNAYLDQLHDSLRPEDQDHDKLRLLRSQLPTITRQAIEDADSNEQLNEDAYTNLCAKLLKTVNSRDEKAVKQTLHHARSLVKATPAIYQRGKDRASSILLSIKHKLAQTSPRLVNNLSNDLIRIAERVHKSPLLNAEAVPAPIAELLDLMAPR